MVVQCSCSVSELLVWCVVRCVLGLPVLVEAIKKLNFQAVIKPAASAASPMGWEFHGSARTTASASGRRPRKSQCIKGPKKAILSLYHIIFEYLFTPWGNGLQALKTKS